MNRVEPPVGVVQKTLVSKLLQRHYYSGLICVKSEKVIVPKYDVCVLGLLFYCSGTCGLRHKKLNQDLDGFVEVIDEIQCSHCSRDIYGSDLIVGLLNCDCLLCIECAYESKISKSSRCVSCRKVILNLIPSYRYVEKKEKEWVMRHYKDYSEHDFCPY